MTETNCTDFSSHGGGRNGLFTDTNYHIGGCGDLTCRGGNNVQKGGGSALSYGVAGGGISPMDARLFHGGHAPVSTTDGRCDISVSQSGGGRKHKHKKMHKKYRHFHKDSISKTHKGHRDFETNKKKQILF